MEHIINIINEIKKLETEHAEKKADKSIDTYTQMYDRLIKEEQELEQEYNETKDVWKRKELNEAKLNKRKEIEAEIKKIRAREMRSRREIIRKLYTKLDENKANINENIQKNRQLIEENKQEMYRIKANRDKLKDSKGIIKPEYQNLYEDMTKQLLEKREQNRKLQNEIKEMETFLQDIETKNLDKYVKEPETKQDTVTGNKTEETSSKEDEKIKEDEEKAWGIKSKTEEAEEALIAAQAAKEIKSWEEQEDKKEQEEDKKEQDSTNIITNVNQNGFEADPTIIDDNDAHEYESKLTIYPNIVEVNLPGYKSIINLKDGSENEMELLDELPYEIKANADISIVRALWSDKKILDHYFDICELYYYKNNDINSPELETVIGNFELLKEFPDIEYALKDLRKDQTLTGEQKLQKYLKAKETKKMFKQMGIANKIGLKMGLIDKAYFEIKAFSEKVKSKLALPSAQNVEIPQAEQEQPEETNKRQEFVRTLDAQEVDEERAVIEAFHKEMHQLFTDKAGKSK